MVKDNIEFQIYDYSEDHDVIEYDEDEYKPLTDYIIHVFGRTQDNKSIYAKVTGFTPFFYIELPTSWASNTKAEIEKKLNLLHTWLKSKANDKVWFRFKDTLLSVDYIRKKNPDGFTFDPITKKERKFNGFIFFTSFTLYSVSSLLLLFLRFFLCVIDVPIHVYSVLT